jgi:hypothetical protein
MVEEIKNKYDGGKFKLESESMKQAKQGHINEL